MEFINQTNFLGAFIAYLAGSIPFGLVLTKLTGAGNLREIGSGNIGATNVLRTGRKGIAIATLILDGGKGLVPVLIAQHYSIDLVVIAGIFAVLGHIFPIWLRFRGGKGVATIMGVFLATAWQIGLLAIGTWLVVMAIFRYSSLAAILALILSPFYAWFVEGNQIAVMATILATISVFRHIENIRRLLRGEEGKINLENRIKLPNLRN